MSAITRRLALIAVFLTAGPQSVAADGHAASFDCLLAPHRLVNVAIATSGIVKDVYVERGDRVQRGQRLAELDSRIEQANVKIARARAERKAQIEAARKELEFRERRLSSSRELFKKKHVSAQELDEAETERNVAALRVRNLEEELVIQRLELERAVQILDVRSVLSPFDGVVVERLVSPGEYVDSTSVVALAKTNPLNVEVVAPSGLIGQISPGMRAMVEPEAPIGGSYEARVVIVDSVVDAASGTFGIRLELPNPDNRIPAGLRCQVRFVR